MKQVLQSYRSGEMWLADVPVPACRQNGIIVQTRASLVSAGTERMLIEFARKNLIGKAIAMPDQVKKVISKIQSEGFKSTMEKVNAKLDNPVALGYSCVGIVEEVGENIRGLQKGDLVACAGAGYASHAEYNYIPKNLYAKVPDGVSPDDAACATVGSIAMQGVRQCDARIGETICVIGLGLIGTLAVQMLKAAGCVVIGYDPDASRCDAAKDLGADLTCSTGLTDACINATNGMGVDAVLIAAATGSNEPIALAGEICRHKGTVVATGLVGMDIPREEYYRKELDFRLSMSYGPGRYDTSYEEDGQDYPFGYVRWTEQRNIESVLQLIKEKKVTPSKLVTHRFSIDDSLKAYDLLDGNDNEPYLGILIEYPEKDASIESTDRIKSIKEAKATASAGKATIGIIGAGNFAKSVLLPAIRQCEARLIGLCTRGGAESGETAKKEGFEYATTDVNQILNDENINTVFIITRHDSHAELVCQALKAGKNVFVEKPLAISSEQLQAITDTYLTLPEDKRPILMTGFNRRFSPHAELLKKYFDKRQSPMVINYRVNAGELPADSWINDPEKGGGRIIGECCHFIDFAGCLADSDVAEVKSSCIQSSGNLVAEDNVAISVRYEDGSILNLCYTSMGATDLPKERCEIFANGSWAILDDFRTTECSGRLGTEKLSTKQAKGFEEELNAFISAVENGSESPIPFRSLISTTQCTLSALESLRS
ncbi:hypothetical protein BVX94_00610 [bacterium B17]|nr:hypothetical protein BVX94_00610 [bacterium B17]